MNKKELMIKISMKKDEIDEMEWELERTDDFDMTNAKLMELDDELAALEKQLKELELTNE